MASYRYRALTGEGVIVDGVEEAASRSSLLSILEARDLLPVEVESAAADQTSAAGPRLKLSSAQIQVLTEDLGTLIGQGITLDRALRVMMATARRPVAALLGDLHGVILCGGSLSQALARHPTLFSSAYICTVAAAESSGALDSALRLLASDLKRQADLKRQVAGAIAYPAFLFVAAFVVLIFILTVVVPQFQAAGAASDMAAAGQTATIFALSDFIRANGPALLAALACCLAGGAALAGSPSFRDRAYEAASRLPGLRTIAATERTVAFSGLLSMLVTSGVDLSSTLRQLGPRLHGRETRRIMDEVLAGVRDGRRLTDVLAAHPLLPLEALQMLRVGEETGELGAAAARVAAVYQTKLDRALTRMTAILGPAMLLAVSALIAWIIISVVTTMIDFSGVPL